MKDQLKKITGLVAVFALMLISVAAHAVVSPELGVPFERVVHFCNTTVGKGTLSGKDYANCKAIADGNVFAIPAQTIISKVYVIIDTTLVGTTGMAIGDDDSATGFASDQNITTAGLYMWAANAEGAYLQLSQTLSGGVPVVLPNAKYYSAVGKTVKLDMTGNVTAGKFRVFIQGKALAQPN